MADEYQRGSDSEWAKAEADELRHQLQRRERQLGRERLLTLMLLAALGWVLWKYTRGQPLETLWTF
jgi:hypothetical protein